MPGMFDTPIVSGSMMVVNNTRKLKVSSCYELGVPMIDRRRRDSSSSLPLLLTLFPENTLSCMSRTYLNLETDGKTQPRSKFAAGRLGSINRLSAPPATKNHQRSPADPIDRLKKIFHLLYNNIFDSIFVDRSLHHPTAVARSRLTT